MAIYSEPGIPDRGPSVFIVTTTTTAVASVFVFSRLYCRRFIVRLVTVDDWYLIAAWVFAVGLAFTICFGVANGLGRHDDDIPDEDIRPLRKTEYNPALMATKTSILMFYLRLSKNTNAVLRLASWVVLVIVNLAGAVLTLMNIFQCRPIRAGWGPWEEGAKCIPLLTEFICAAPVNVITDLAILVLPLPVLTGMKLPLRQKIILVGTFLLGAFVTIVDVVRIYYLQQAITKTPTKISSDIEAIFGGQPGFSWHASLALMWSIVEVNVGIICACIPTLKPLIARICPALVIDPNFNSGTSVSRPFEDKTTSSNDHASANQYEHTPSPPPATTPTAAPTAAPTTSSTQMSMAEFLAEHTDVSEGDISTIYERRARASTFATMPSISEVQTNATAPSIQEQQIYFGFVEMKKPKSILACSKPESWKYCSVVTTLFFLWGFSYGLLNSLNNAVSYVSNLSTPKSLSLATMYFGGGYLLGPLLVGSWILRRDEHQRMHHVRNRDTDRIGGFKILFMVGLWIYGLGTIIFWPSAVTNSYGGFMLSNFVAGFGLAILETGANTFLVLCGHEDYGAMRLMLAQAVQATGSIISNTMSTNIFFKNLTTNSNGSQNLINVQWTYLSITLLCTLLVMFFYYMPLPEVTDIELRKSARHSPVAPDKRYLGGIQLRTICLTLAILSQWTYTATQASMRIFFTAYLVSLDPYMPTSGPDAVFTGSRFASYRIPGFSLKVSDYYAISQSAFTLSRYVFALILYLSVGHRFWPKPRILLTLCALGTIAVAIVIGLVNPSNNDLIAIPVSLFYFFMGPIWPLIFALGLRHQGARTKAAGAFITMAASGPGGWIFVQYAIVACGGTMQSTAFFLVALQVVTLLFPMALNVSRDMKLLTDPQWCQQVDAERAERHMASNEAGRGESRQQPEFVDSSREEFAHMEAHDYAAGQHGEESRSSSARPESAEPAFITSAL
ncbi:hypothetical protein TD95_004044 [Thielaviopsis punctulata]|uniref:Rhodopsin domain-containing protein n=1 Tax=Thielaviopsis punctulata TaxID=72032 RepID=A0A0F4ZGJ5_9PEZI|nr:hypothetical protein TD95_004044 [Thielaviopsis punctulata]